MNSDVIMITAYPPMKLTVCQLGLSCEGLFEDLQGHVDVGRRHLLVLPSPEPEEPGLEDGEALKDDETADEAEPEQQLVISSKALEVEFHCSARSTPNRFC